jgi:hypothetical protein
LGNVTTLEGETLSELRLGDSNVAGEFAGREPDRNGDADNLHPTLTATMLVTGTLKHDRIATGLRKL